MKKALSLLLALALCLSFAACGENSGGHTCSGEWEILEAATCFEEGTRQRTCSCGKVESETIPALTHVYKDGICELCSSADPDYKPEPTVSLTFASAGDGTCYVTGILPDSDLNVVIPETSPEGEKVVSIGENAFKNTNITSVRIPKTVNYIFSYAFADCKNLTTVVVDSDSLLYTISQGAFMGCTALKQMNIPDSVSKIYSEAFRGCSGLADIEIPAKTVVQIDIFVGCTGLKKVKLNSYMPYYLFSECTALENVVIPDALAEVYGSDDTWQECLDLLKTEGGGTVERKPSEGLEFTTNGDGTCAVTGMGSCTDTIIVIPETAPNGDKVVAIGAEAFNKCYQIKQVIMPQTMTEIGVRAFKDCSGLNGLDLPESVTVVSSGAFDGCNSLTTLTIRSKTVVSCPYYSNIHDANSQPKLTALYVPAELVEQYKNGFNWATIENLIYPISK